MVDFYTQARTMRLADPEDRALLGSNPSAAVGDGDSDRSGLKAAPVPKQFSFAVLVPNALNPLSFITIQPEPKPAPKPDRSAIWQYLTERRHCAETIHKKDFAKSSGELPLNTYG